jgi:DNA-binding NtrC family response regulator
MKRKVLFIGYEPSLNEEIKDFILTHKGEAFFTNSVEDSIHVLDEKPINTVVLTLHKLGDAAILKYINQYFPDIKVLISASKEYDDIINVFNKGRYSMLKQPFRLKELNLML